MQIRVIKDSGDKQGPNITDPLLTSDSVGIEAGKWAINDSTSKKIEDGNGPLHSFEDTGQLVQIETKKGIKLGKLTFFSQTIDIDTEGRNYFPTSSFKVQGKLE